jgi:hypothetical protein
MTSFDLWKAMIFELFECFIIYLALCVVRKTVRRCVFNGEVGLFLFFSVCPRAMSDKPDLSKSTFF